MANAFLKEKLKVCLYRRDKVITLATVYPKEIFREVVIENPEISLFVDRVQIRKKYCEADLIVEYAPETPIFYKIANDGELENALHEAISRFKRSFIIISPKSYDLTSGYINFITKYKTFYSNLMDMDYSSPGYFFENPDWRYDEFTLRFRIGTVMLGIMEREVNDRVRELSKKLFLPEMSDEVKAYVAHNYLAKMVEYHDAEVGPLEKSYLQSAYGALVNRKCVCQGYAEAYKRILDTQDIKCEVICGKVRGHESGHAWNIVHFGEKGCYHIDVTWDSLGDGKKRDDYFCLNDEKMSPDRIWTRTDDMVCNFSGDILGEAKRQIAENETLFIERGIEKIYLE